MDFRHKDPEETTPDERPERIAAGPEFGMDS